MSSDLIRIVEELINSGKGDSERLNQILNTLKNGEALGTSDHEYIEQITSNKISPDVTTRPDTEESKTSLSEVPQTSNIPESTGRSIPTKKYAAVGIAVAIVFIAYVGLDVYAVNMLQFRPHQGQQIIISDTELGIKSDVCNPSYFPATFSKYQIVAYYKSAEIENATIVGDTVSPKSAATLNGIFTLNKDTISKFASQNFTFNVTQAHVTTKVVAPIFGFIPYSVNKEYAADEFQKVLKNGPPGSYSC